MKPVYEIIRSDAPLSEKLAHVGAKIKSEGHPRSQDKDICDGIHFLCGTYIPALEARIAALEGHTLAAEPEEETAEEAAETVAPETPPVDGENPYLKNTIQELRAMIAERNKGRESAQKIVADGGQKDLAAKLWADDQAAAPAQLTTPETTDETPAEVEAAE